MISFLGSVHPCDNNDYPDFKTNCCLMGTSSMDDNLEAIMKVMRLAKRRGKSRIDLKDLIAPLVENPEYGLTFHGKKLEDLGSEKDVNSMIPFCQLKAAKAKQSLARTTYEAECNLFDPVVTDLGLCHSFNAQSTTEMLKPSYFVESFKNAFESDLPEDEIIWNGTGLGKEHSLNFYLFDNRARRFMGPKTTSFKMGLSTLSNYFDMKTTSEDIMPGYHTIWKVQAMEIYASDDLHDVPVDKRNCKFPDEVSEMEIFDVYSKKACEFECALKGALDICRCYPWYIPAKPSMKKHTVCNTYGNYCFRETMTRINLSKNCTCLPTCHHIEFTHVEQLRPIDVDKACYNGLDSNPMIETYSIIRQIGYMMMDNGYNSVAHDFFEYRRWEQGHETGKAESWNKATIDSKLCEKIVKHMAMVTVMFDKDTYVRTKSSVRVSFSDKLAAFGNNLLYNSSNSTHFITLSFN